MPKDLRFYLTRLELFHELKKMKCPVRWHAYEYLIFCKDFICVVLLEPWKDTASIFFRGNHEKINYIKKLLLKYNVNKIVIKKID
ncbi:MAG: hypothetical protein DRN04_02545 [Thermoprotei archaeon]|nr:MAG: hypothetical protein DRN04_02545 [Thermoprotei archaeon]